MAEALHRFAGDYWAQSEWRQMPEASLRLRRALGNEPLPDLRHRLPLPPPSPTPKPLPPGPHPGTSLLVDLAATEPLSRELLQLALAERHLAERLEGAVLWGYRRGEWSALTQTYLGRAGDYDALTLAWERTHLPGGSLQEVAQAVAECHAVAADLAAFLGAQLTRGEDPREAAAKSARLVQLKQRFARSIELRWVASGAPLPARTLWRLAYSLGFGWGHLDLFYWPGPPHTPLFTLTSLGKPGYFLPERAVEGEAIPGIALSFELPSCPIPLETFDHMALALAAFRELLGGSVYDGQGNALDGERLDGEREALLSALRQLQEAGIAPGSEDARAFF